MNHDLAGHPRLIIAAQLAPVAGSTFQPTGFPDLGAAEFERPLADGGIQQALLVESVQSLANHLEDVGWNHDENRPASALGDLPYVEVRNKDGRFLTSSRLEPHRLAGAYIKDSQIDDGKAGKWMIERFAVEKGVPVNWKAIYSGIFQLDPMCLIHGVFFSDPEWKDYGNPKVSRAVTAVIEAHGVRPVVSGGVKRDDVNPTVGQKGGSREGYGFIPFGRTEYTAEEIVLEIVVDLEQIRGYGLGEDETNLLTTAALWEVQTLLAQPLRLRTACDLEVESLEVRRPNGYELPTADDLAQEMRAAKVEFDAEIPRTAVSG